MIAVGFIDSIKAVFASPAGGLIEALLSAAGQRYAEQQAQDLMDSFRLAGYTHPLTPPDAPVDDAIEVVTGIRIRAKDDDFQGTVLPADSAVKQAECLAQFVRFASKAAKHVSKHSGPYKGG